ncbi:CCA tRNA nucleotidyltransferase [Candidatus Geothermarchaeota archaeon]|nr:MAG: CCA tRNA nucleotidyltransferase [Candidatus Geothermarchaeota archaeon]
MEDLLKQILKDIVPNENERKKIKEIVQRFKKKTEEAASHYVKEYEVFLGGSVRKDTWISGEADIDLFLLLSPTLPREEFRRIGLKIAEEALKGYKKIKRFAEHPYLEAYVDGIRVSIVPAYKTSKGKWISSVDRTPFHVKYVESNLRDENARNQVRLLKKFMKGIGTYGAEVTVKGFSGYLCELLIIKYGTFKSLLKNAVKWKERTIIDLENYYKGDLETIIRVFPRDPLIVIDPVDPSRNVAAAVSKRTLGRFVSACRSFLKNPSKCFFYPEKREIKIEDEVKRHGKIIFLLLKHGRMVEDILYPQLERLSRKLVRRLEEMGFNILRWRPFSDFKSKSVIFIELESDIISENYLHLGPSFFNEFHEESFLKKNLSKGFFVWIDEDGKWKAIKRRKITNAKEAIKSVLKEGKIIPHGLKEALKAEIFIGGMEELMKRRGLLKFLKDFLTIREFWIGTYEGSN